MHSLLGISRLRARRPFGEDETDKEENGVANGVDAPIVPTVSVTPAEASSPIPPPPPLPASTPQPQRTSLPPPPIRVTEDEDSVIEKLFPQNVPRRPVGPVPMPPTVKLPPAQKGEASAEQRTVAGKVGPRNGAQVIPAPQLGAEMPELVSAPKSWPESGDLRQIDPTSGESPAADLEIAAQVDETSVVAEARAKRSVFGAVLVIGQGLLLNVISIPVSIVIINRLGKFNFGQYSAAFELVTFAGLIATLGLRPLFVRSVAQKPEIAEEELAYQLGLRFFLTLGACAVALGIGAYMYFFQAFPSTYMACVLICMAGMALNMFSLTFADVIMGVHWMKAYAAVNFTAGIISTAATLFVAIKYPNPVALAIAYITTPLVGVIMGWFMVRRRMPIRVRFSRQRSRDMLRESRTIGAYQVSVVVRDRLERVLLPALSGLSNFGFYAAGIIPADRLFVVPEGFVTAFFSAIAKSHHEDEKSAAVPVLQFMKTSLVACAPLAILCTFLADPMARILFPKDPDLCRAVISITIWAVPLRGLQLPMGSALQAVGRHSVAAKTGIFATIFSLALTIVLISTMGIIGACWAWVGRSAISALFLIPAFISAFPTVFKRIPALRIAIGLAAMCGVLWYSTTLKVSIWMTLLIGASLGIAVYFLAMVALKVIDISDLKTMLKRKNAD